MLSVGDSAGTTLMLSWLYWKGVDLLCHLGDLLEW